MSEEKILSLVDMFTFDYMFDNLYVEQGSHVNTMTFPPNYLQELCALVIFTHIHTGMHTTHTQVYMVNLSGYQYPITLLTRVTENNHHMLIHILTS